VEETTFDIFSGIPDKNALWLEAVTGLENARQRMDQIARKTPGDYFLFSVQAHRILVKTNTLTKLESAPPSTNAGATPEFTSTCFK
jgi:hypothetical protein